MSYIVNKTDGTALVTVVDRTLNTTATSLTLVGRGVSSFSDPVFENFVRLLENFAHSAAPAAPLVGQIWFDKNQSALRIYTGTSWDTAATRAYVNTYVANAIASTTAARITAVGDVSGSGDPSALVLTLADSGVAEGTYTKVVVDSKGRVIRSAPLLSGDIITALGFTPAPQSGTIVFPVSSVNGKTGAVSLGVADISGAAPLAAPQFTGVPKVLPAGTNGGRFELTAPAGSASAGMDATGSKFRVFRVSDGGNILSYDLATGSLTVPQDVIATRNVVATGSLRAEGGLVVARTGTLSSNPGLSFEADGTDAGTGLIWQDTTTKSLFFSASRNAAGVWQNPMALTTGGMLSVAGLTASAVAANTVVGTNGSVVSRASGNRSFIFQTGSGAASGSIIQTATTSNGAEVLSGNLSFSARGDGTNAATLAPSGTFTATALTATGMITATGALRANGGQLDIQSTSGVAARMRLLSTTGAERGEITYEASRTAVVISTNGGTPIAVTPQGGVEATGFILPISSADRSGLMMSDEGDRSLAVALNGSPRFVARDVEANGSTPVDNDSLITYGAALPLGNGALDGSRQYVFAMDGASGNAVIARMTRGSVGLSENVIWSAGVTTSDGRLKTNIQPVTSGLPLVRALRAVTFHWMDGHPLDDGKAHLGMIAQEVEKVVPDAVAESRGTKVLHKQELVPLLIKAVQELDAENAALREDNAQQALRLKALEEQMEEIVAALRKGDGAQG